MGKIGFRVLCTVIERDSLTDGVNPRSFGYRSIGLRVPEVMTTVWNRSNTCLIASEASRHLYKRVIRWVHVSQQEWEKYEGVL